MHRLSSSRGKVIAFGVALAVALLAILPGAWSAALAQTAGPLPGGGSAEPTSTEVGAGEETTVELTGTIEIDIPGGAIPVDVTISFDPLADADDAANGDEIADAILELGLELPDGVDDGNAVVFKVFELSALDAGGDEVDFDEPVILEIELTPEILAAAGGDAGNVSLQFYDEATGTWTAVSCSASGNTLSCELPHFSVWALVVQAAADGGADGGAPSPADTGTGLTEDGGVGTVTWVVAALAAVAVVGGLGARIATRRARR